MIVSVLRGALPPTHLRSGGSWICTVAPADICSSRLIDAPRAALAVAQMLDPSFSPERIHFSERSLAAAVAGAGAAQGEIFVMEEIVRRPNTREMYGLRFATSGCCRGIGLIIVGSSESVFPTGILRFRDTMISTIPDEEREVWYGEALSPRMPGLAWRDTVWHPDGSRTMVFPRDDDGRRVLRVFPCEPSEELEERYVQARAAYLREYVGGI